MTQADVVGDSVGGLKYRRPANKMWKKVAAEDSSVGGFFRCGSVVVLSSVASGEDGSIDLVFIVSVIDSDRRPTDRELSMVRRDFAVSTAVESLKGERAGGSRILVQTAKAVKP